MGTGVRTRCRRGTRSKRCTRATQGASARHKGRGQASPKARGTGLEGQPMGPEPSGPDRNFTDMKPKRVQLRRTKGWRLPPNTVVVSRPTKWGNPFRTGNRLHDAFMHHLWLNANPNQWREREMARRELCGKNLACWCPLNGPCHADNLLKAANSPEPRYDGPLVCVTNAPENPLTKACQCSTDATATTSGMTQETRAKVKKARGAYAGTTTEPAP